MLFLLLVSAVPRPTSASTSGNAGSTPTEWGGSGMNLVASIVEDSSGNTYVVGTSDAYASQTVGFSAVILKYSPDGILLWQKIWSGTIGAAATGAALSSDGSALYVTGMVFAPGATPADLETHIFLMKLATSNGASSWTSVKMWGGSGDEFALGIAASSDGSVYITGTANSTDTAYVPQPDPGSGIHSQYGALLLKFSSAGALDWARTLAVPETYYLQGCESVSGVCDSIADAIVVDPQGNGIWIGGETWTPGVTPFVALFSTTGTPSYVDYFEPPAAAPSIVTALALSPNEKTLYIGGTDSYATLNSVLNALVQYFCFAFGCPGTCDVVNPFSDIPGDVADAAGNLFTTYFCPPSADLQYLTYAWVGAMPAGGMQTESDFTSGFRLDWGVETGGGGSFDSVSSLAVQPNGTLYVAGSTSASCILYLGCEMNTFLLKLSPSGQLLSQGIWGLRGWQAADPAVVISSDDYSIMIAGSTNESGGFSFNPLSGINAKQVYCNSQTCSDSLYSDDYSGAWPVANAPGTDQVTTPGKCSLENASLCYQMFGSFVLDAPCDPNLLQCPKASQSTVLPSTPSGPVTGGNYIEMFLDRLPLLNSGEAVQPMLLSDLNGGSVQWTISGCDASPSSIPGDGNVYDVILEPNCTPTVSYSDSGTVRYVFPSSAPSTSMEFETCSTSYYANGEACSWVYSGYYEQFANSFSYSISGGGDPPAPVIDYYSAGQPQSASLTSTATLIWMDAGSAWFVPYTLSTATCDDWTSSTTVTSSVVTSGGASSSFVYDNNCYLLTVSASGDGTVSPSSAYYTPGASVKLTATATSGAAFEGWTGTYTSSATTLTVTMNSAVTETATFTTPHGGGCGGLHIECI